jgi:DNA helicase-2/ATP-dependent DNA helicase PcrA
MQSDDKLEEERRLCYVAITRAMKNLYISYASQRLIYNQLSYNAPSRFIGEIPDRLVDNEWIVKRQRSFPGYPEQPQGHVSPRRGSRAESEEGPLTFGVPKIVTRGAGVGSKSAALGIRGVQKGFTPSVAASVAPSALMSLFAVGDRVMHRKFGEGDVLEIRGNGNDARIVISFAAYGQKEFALNIAPIVKVNK